jgi:hypothetical protein
MSRLAPEARHLLELDLRPVQEVGGDPWEAVGAALARLPADGVLTLATSDRPTPVHLPAPGPLEGVLEATARLAPGAAFLARVPRYPRMLLPRLSERGLEFEVREEQDGTALVHVRRPR